MFTSSEREKLDSIVFGVFQCEFNDLYSFEFFDENFVFEKIMQSCCIPPSLYFKQKVATLVENFKLNS